MSLDRTEVCAIITISFKLNPSFSCDLCICQSTYDADIRKWKRIQNNKILQLEATEGWWYISDGYLWIVKDKLFDPGGARQIIALKDIPENFLVIPTSKTKGEGRIRTPQAELYYEIKYQDC